MILLSDINLDKILFNETGSTIELRFIDMNEGLNIAAIKCISILAFNFQNCFDDQDYLPCYVGEMECRKLSDSEAIRELEKLHYGFLNNDVSSLGQLNVIHLDGGEISMRIVCRDVEYQAVVNV